MKSRFGSGLRSEAGALRVLIDHRQDIGLSSRRLGTVAVLSALTGLGQAAILIVIIRVATALTADTAVISGTVGPITATGLTTGNLIVLGFVLLGLLLVAEFATSWAQASLLSEAQRSTQKRLLARYSAARFDTQTRLSRGETGAVVFGHSTQAAAVVGLAGAGLVSLVNFVTLVGSALVLSPIAGVVAVGGLSLMLLAMRPLNLASRRLGDRRATEQRRTGALQFERLELSHELKAFGVESAADKTIQLQIDLMAKLGHRLGVVSRMTSATYRIGAYSLVLAALAVILLVNSSALTSLTGALLLLLRSLSYGQAAQSTYQQLTEKVPLLRQLVEEEERFEDEAETVGTSRLPERIGRLVLRNVGFAYRDQEPVLHDVNLEIAQGDFVALVGPSGAGKSTLMYLLLRLRYPTIGDIEVDGVPAAQLDLGWWRRRVAYVPQEPKLRAGSVTEAIRFHRQDISDEDVRFAAAQAHISHEIESWSMGYDTEVGQLGDQISGGQRQRIALARALAGKPDLLLLDEPTSALDPVSERLITDTLDALRGQLTIVVIAHKFSTVQRSNRVILLEDGSVTPHVGDDVSTLEEFMGRT